MTPAEKLALFLSFIANDYYTSTASISEHNPAENWVDTLLSTLTDYRDYLTANIPEPTPEQSATVVAGTATIDACNALNGDYSDLTNIEAKIVLLKTAAANL